MASNCFSLYFILCRLRHHPGSNNRSNLHRVFYDWASENHLVDRSNSSWIGLGIVATWWVGLILGVPLATIARIGSRSKISVSLLIRPVAVLLGCNALLATLAGFFGYIAASKGWVFLIGRIAERVPQDKHIPFIIDIWVHSASYLGGFLGGIILIIWVWRSRGRATPNGFQERKKGQVA